MRVRVGGKLASAITSITLALAATALHAQVAIQFELPAQSLADSLRTVGSQTNTNLLFDPPLVAGIRAPAVSAQLTAEQALERLLLGTGIHYQFLNENTVILTSASAVRPTSGDPSTKRGSEALLQRADAAIVGVPDAGIPEEPVAGAAKRDKPQQIQVTGLRGNSVGSSSAGIQTLQDVVVTAQKRAEKLLDVPMSVTAITGDRLTRQGATSLLDIASTVPGMATAQFSPGQNHVELRGISSLQGLPTVGTYLDEMPLNVFGGFPTYGADIRFIDLDRIEVLRGPQGTLYGEESMGGTIKYVARDPNLQTASFGFDGAAGTVTNGSQLYRGNIVVNVPVVDGTFGVRLAGGYEKSAGWINYPAVGVKDANSGVSETVRLKGLWKISDSFTATLLLLYQNDEYNANNLAAPDQTTPFVLLTPYIDKNRLASLVLRYDASSLSILSATGYMDRTSNQTLDFTTLLGGVYTIFGVSPGSPDYPKSVAANATFDFKAFSEELRFSSRSEGPFTWTAGLYYRDYWESGTDLTTAVPNPLPYELLNTSSSDESKSEAMFGQASYRFTPAFDATVGLRYFRDDRTIPSGSGGSEFGGPVVIPFQEATFTSVDPKLVFSYRLTPDTLLYASAAKGFRSGGMNGTGAIAAGCAFPVNFDPEKLWTYEVGSNISAAGGRLMVQSSVYYNDWQSIQELQYCPGLATLGPQTVSGGRGKGEGVDLQTTWWPIDPLTLRLSGSYNNSYYEDKSAAHNPGDRIDFVPRWTTALAGDYDFQWTKSVGGRLHVDYQYSGAWTIALRDQLAVATGLAYAQSYGLVNARLSAREGFWELSVFAQNLTDTQRAAIPKYGGYLEPTSMQPRTVGVGIRYNY